ncbi:hypothetical protein [Nonomuraea zeae]|uniref:Uncharacterized protein n=1 Tax=Nonomuraea zeae TaxID=1642303 RepID=A0A5S4FI04_9ACTN|nr:hypothetical protein [Nonomuraea zeae]TMR19349.1 hypothetical protein ETD85_52920 [Nonomuraea zeae]
MSLHVQPSEDLAPPFFSHAPRPAGARPELRAATRYLCAAAYLDMSFREKVLAELLEDAHRAVARSHDGLDIEAVLRHCLRARRLALTRDVLLVLAMAAALVTEPVTLVMALALFVPLLRFHRAPFRRPGRPARVGTYVVSAAAVCLFLWLVLTEVRDSMDPGTRSWIFGLGAPFGAGLALFAALTVLILLGFRVLVVHTLARRLGAGRPYRAPRVYGPWARRRIRYAAGAQHGNITLYSGDGRSDDDGEDDEEDRRHAAARSPFLMFPDDPAFLGAGSVARVWSISVELDLKSGNRLKKSIDVDPVELHRFVKKRMESMRDKVRRDSERIRNLTTHDHVVARGLISRPKSGQAESLIDHRSWQPYSLASPETVAALIRNPQAGIRHYQLVMVGSERHSVSHGDGRQIAPAEDQEVVVSAFIHLAVEGRMLYTEFVSTVLPPIRQDFHVIDQLPRGPLAFAMPIRSTPPVPVVQVALGALPRLGSALLSGISLTRLAQTPRLQVMHDYGARRSVRELGASGALSFTQRLDAFKYTKLISQRLTEAVIDFLDREGVDTQAFRQQATSVMMSTSINITNSQLGDQAVLGNFGPVQQNTPASPNPAGGPDGTATSA